MENKLYSAIKHRMFEEMNLSIQRHPTYAHGTKAYNRLHMGKERPQTGVVLQSVSSSRINLSPDDYIGDLWSLVALTRVGNYPGSTIEWVWEDAYNLTPYVEKEDVSSTLDPLTQRTVTVANAPIAAGNQNTMPATSFGQVKLYVNGVPLDAAGVDAASGQIRLPYSASSTDKIEVSYYYVDVDKPGYYFIEFDANDNFMITPMYSEFNEVLIAKTTGVEVNAQLTNSPVLLDYVLNLTTKKNFNSTLIYLDRGVDYDVDETGLVTFLRPLQTGTTVYASYRWRGEDRGPFPVKDEYQYIDSAIKGVVLSVGSRKQAGDKQVVVLNPQREQVAKVYGGHYIMNLEWKVFTRDPMSTEELTDHLISDIWGNRKEPLRWEGITIEACDATGEMEESYDDATQAVYFQNTISMEIMTEWKKFVPYILKLAKYRAKVSEGRVVPTDVKDSVTAVNPSVWFEEEMWVDNKPFQVIYPKTAYPRFY